MTPVEAVLAVHEWFYLAETNCLLQRFGCARLADLPPALAGEFVEFAQATLIFNTPPSSSWANGVPMEYAQL